jgi:hypothetical protein
LVLLEVNFVGEPSLKKAYPDTLPGGTGETIWKTQGYSEIPGLDLGQETGSFNWSLSWFTSVSPDTGQGRCRLRFFQFIFHCSS